MNNEVQISVIIVNYNVEFFLEQCLNSVFKALKECSGEVFVVDNNSFDGSIKMVKEKFPSVQLIENKENVGFSRANNQAIKISKGKYVLLLNPDTVVEENTFKEVIQFMDEHPDAGGLGVRMLDGKGNFLPESKRGIPTPFVAFYKIFGLSKLFPKSKKFGKYHLGYLSEFETNEIEILSGAFMLMRKETLDKVGLLDEDFFMYGEDIDLSYRILLGGYKNYYFPDTRIIHYKGESTKKSSVNYVFVFYRAMIIFAKKHFTKKHIQLFSFAINLAIYFRASLAIISRLIKRLTLPVSDFLLLSTGGILLSRLWTIKGITFDEKLIRIAIPIYILTWMFSIIYQGGYDKTKQVKDYLKGTLYGTISILIIYALLPKNIQFSRFFILIASVWIFSYYLISRLFLSLFNERFNIYKPKRKRFLIVGDIEESSRVANLLDQMSNDGSKCYFISAESEYSSPQIGRINQIHTIVKEYRIDEVVFCAKNCSSALILEWMNRLNHLKIDFKIAQPDTSFIIGSNSINAAGDLYYLDINNINTEKNIRNKRTFDVLLSIILLITAPFHIWIQDKKAKFATNLLDILIGKMSFVGYSYHFENENEQVLKLPYIKKGVLTPHQGKIFSNLTIQNKMNLIYARDYSVYTDFKIVYQNFKQLGGK